MNTNKKIARIAGVLFLIPMIVGLINANFIISILSAPLINIYTNKIPVLMAALPDLINCIAIVVIAVILFPILKEHNETLALGFVGFSIIECTILIIGVISSLLLIPLSQEYIKAGAPVASYFPTIGALAIKGRFWAYQIAMIICGLSGLILCYSMYQSELIPRFISFLGLIGYASLSTCALLDIFGVIDWVHGSGITLYIQRGLLGLIFFPFWMIFKGFNSYETDSAYAGIDTDNSENGQFKLHLVERL